MTKGKVALVDAEDYEELAKYSWHYDITGYACRRRTFGYRDSKKVYMHRELFGEIDEGLVVDHVDRDKLNNTRVNLRLTTQRYNSANSKPRKGTSKYKGVSWNSQSSKWASKIEKNGSFYSLGNFNCEENAALAYNNKAKELYGEFAFLNDVNISEIDLSKEYRPSSQYVGVTYVKSTGKWRAYIRVNGKQEHLGLFECEKTAAERYNFRARSIYGKEAVLNDL